MTWKVGTAAVAAATALFIAAAPPASARDRHHGHHRGHAHHGYYGNNWGAGIAGFTAGAILGGALASQPTYGYYGSGRSVAWCERNYRSYDRRTRTYLGYDGYRHPCP